MKALYAAARTYFAQPHLQIGLAVLAVTLGAKQLIKLGSDQGEELLALNREIVDRRRRLDELKAEIGQAMKATTGPAIEEPGPESAQT